MSDDYTPTTGDVRSAYTRAMRQAFITSTGEHIAEFDRWLDQYTRQKQAEALRDAARAWRWSAWSDAPRHVDRAHERMATANYAGDWLDQRADELEKGQDDA